MNELSHQIASQFEIMWQLCELETGSAKIALVGLSEQEEAVEKVTQAYGLVGQALQTQSPIPYAKAVAEQAYGIASVINGHITAVDFEIEGHKSKISQPIQPQNVPSDEKNYEFGTITGIALSLLRNPLRISVEDALFERVVQCHTPASYESLMREAWGKPISVTGLIYRNPENGRPEQIKSVVELKILDEPADPLQSFAAVRGVLPWVEDAPASENFVRRLREDDV